MSNNLFKESLLFGNLENIFSLRQIKNFDVHDTYVVLQEFKLENNGIYRFYNNYNSLVASKEIELIKGNHPDAIFLLEIIKDLISKANKLGVFQNTSIHINVMDYNSIIKVFIYNMIQLVESKYRYHEQKLDVFEECFGKKIMAASKESVVIDHVVFFEDNIWSPSWRIVHKNKNYYLEGVDVYLDNMFVNYNIKFNQLMISDIKHIDERISFLKKNALEYYNSYMIDNIKNLTYNIFSTFPYYCIYYQYYEALKNHSEFYHPPLTSVIKLEEFNKDIYLFSIMPNYITAYLLGYPILRCDIPAYKNMMEKIKSFDLDYYKGDIIDYNRKMIKLNAMGIECGNSVDEDNDFLDINYNKVVDFNIDDTIQVYNNGVYHLFTSPEFNDIVKKESNFYNRSKINILNPVIYNMKFKKKIKRYLWNRGLKVELNSTMESNFKEIKTAIRNKDCFNLAEPEVENNPLLNLLFGI